MVCCTAESASCLAMSLLAAWCLLLIEHPSCCPLEAKALLLPQHNGGCCVHCLRRRVPQPAVLHVKLPAHRAATCGCGAATQQAVAAASTRNAG
jgi:hypothetical protein